MERKTQYGHVIGPATASDQAMAATHARCMACGGTELYVCMGQNHNPDRSIGLGHYSQIRCDRCDYAVSPEYDTAREAMECQSPSTSPSD